MWIKTHRYLVCMKDPKLSGTHSVATVLQYKHATVKGCRPTKGIVRKTHSTQTATTGLKLSNQPCLPQQELIVSVGILTLMNMSSA